MLLYILNGGTCQSSNILYYTIFEYVTNNCMPIPNFVTLYVYFFRYVCNLSSNHVCGCVAIFLLKKVFFLTKRMWHVEENLVSTILKVISVWRKFAVGENLYSLDYPSTQPHAKSSSLIFQFKVCKGKSSKDCYTASLIYTTRDYPTFKLTYMICNTLYIMCKHHLVLITKNLANNPH